MFHSVSGFILALWFPIKPGYSVSGCILALWFPILPGYIDSSCILALWFPIIPGYILYSYFTRNIFYISIPFLLKGTMMYHAENHLFLICKLDRVFQINHLYSIYWAVDRVFQINHLHSIVDRDFRLTIFTQNTGQWTGCSRLTLFTQ